MEVNINHTDSGKWLHPASPTMYIIGNVGYINEIGRDEIGFSHVLATGGLKRGKG